MSRKIVLGLVATVGVAVCVSLVTVLTLLGLGQASLWAAVLGLPVAVVGSGAALWALVPRPPKVPLPPDPEVPEWVIDRPKELDAVVAALVDGPISTVGITTGLFGAGGFGKTILAKMVCADRRVKKRFGGRVYLVTVGRDVRGAAIAAKVNDVIKLVAGEDVTFTDPQLAGQWLGSLLDIGPSSLLVLDDLWKPDQLEPFTTGGRQCTRLVTTRVPGLLIGKGTAVQVDQMSPEQARALLTSGLPPLDSSVADGLLAVTGRWPLLLRLVNKVLEDYSRMATAQDVSGKRPDLSEQAKELLSLLRAGGPVVVDDLLSDAGPGLDVGLQRERERAVQATIGASSNLLDQDDAERFAELGVFAEDETIPFTLLARLWRASAGLNDLKAAQVCKQLVQLALVSEADGGIALHDVIRDFLQRELGTQRLRDLNRMLLVAIAADLPTAMPLDGASGAPDAKTPTPSQVAWWELGSENRYPWDHLIEHLLDSERPEDADAVACDLRWVGARLELFGPAAPVADLSLVTTSWAPLSLVAPPRAARLSAVLARAAHLLGPTMPTPAVVDVLHSRVADDPDWGLQVTALRDTFRRPRLINRWPIPDLPDPAIRRVLDDLLDEVGRLAIAPDGSWLATGGHGTVRIWDTATWQPRISLTGQHGVVNAVAAEPQGRWLAIGGSDGLRILDTATWQTVVNIRAREYMEILGRDYSVATLVISPGGGWLAAGGFDGRLRIWDTTTWRPRTVPAYDMGIARAAAIAPDGTWLAVGSFDGLLRIWNTATWQEKAILTGHSKVAAVAITPDGSWLATAGSDREGASTFKSGTDVGTVRIWDTATWQGKAILTGDSDEVRALAVAPGGRWLVTGSSETLRIWDTATWQEKAILTGPADRGLAIEPDGAWLASCGQDGRVRIWDTATLQTRAAPAGETADVEAIVAGPGVSWLATSGADRTARSREGYAGRDARTVRIWDAATRQQGATLTSRAGILKTVPMAIAPDGSWLATGDEQGVRIWDPATWQPLATLISYPPYTFRAVAIAPDGSWLASGSHEEIRVWDTATWQPQAILTGHAEGVEALAPAGDGSWLASSSDSAVRVWDTSTWRPVANLTSRFRMRGPGIVIAGAPDGSWLATSSPGKIRIWDTATWQSRTVSNGDSDSVRTVTSSPVPDANWLATAAWHEKTVRIWDTATWQPLATLTGHFREVEAVAVAPDGRWLATVGSRDQTVRIWDTTSWQPSAMMRVDNTIRACAWLGPNGLALGGVAGLYVFDLLRTHPASA